MTKPTVDVEGMVTYTTQSASGNKYAVRVLKSAPPEAHDEAKRHLSWKAANESVVLTGNPYKPLQALTPTISSDNTQHHD